MAKNPLPKNLPIAEQWGGTIYKIARYPTEDTKIWSAFNPSVGYSKEDGLIVLIRSSNYFYDVNGHTNVTSGNYIENRIFFGRIDDKYELKEPLRKITFIDGPTQERGCEDAKLFQRNGEWRFHAVMRELDHTPYPRIVEYKLDIDKLEASFVKKYESYEHNRVEKNWMTPMEKPSEHFDFVYDPTSTYKDGLVVIQEYNPPKEAKELRGGTNLLEVSDGYLAVGHSLYADKKVVYNPRTFSYGETKIRRYTHRFEKYDQRGKLIGLSDEFVFEDFIIEFAAGIVEKDDNYIISYGRHDLSSKLCVIPKEKFHEKLKPITYGEKK